MLAGSEFAAFEGRKYLSLETYRKSGQGVRTPVWFVAPSDAGAGVPTLYVYTTADTGKAKRIRNNGTVRIAPCDARGKITGEWIDARARIVTSEEARGGMRLLDRKYFPWKQMLGVFALFRPRERIVIAIRHA
jgi:PPOX class probable F420-dependent enzyme